MTAVFKVEYPNEIKMTLNVTMKMSEWKELREQLDKANDYPAWSLRSYVDDLVAQAEKHFYPCQQ